MRRLTTVCAATALLCGLVGTSQANLILNGDFESPVLGNVNPTDLLPGSSALTGWTIGGAGSVTVNHVGSGFSFWNPPLNSSQFLDLTGSSGGAYIEQTFATTLNTTYLVTFDTFNGSLVYTTGGTPSHGIDVSATGGATLQVSVTPGTAAFASYYFTATGTSTTLRFAEVTGFDSNAGWIDNVSVSAVPEAGTLIAGALLLLPFGASTLRILRRRQAGANA